jgi:FkbM family methyltransferase
MARIQDVHVLVAVCVLLSVALAVCRWTGDTTPIVKSRVQNREEREVPRFVSAFSRAGEASSDAGDTLAGYPSVVTPKFHSQSKEDRALAGCMLRNVREGVYVEIGALDGKLISNTLHFEEDMGWKGILIEGEPRNAARLLRNRANDKNIIVPFAACSPGERSVRYVTAGGAKEASGIADSMPSKKKSQWGINGRTGYDVNCTTLAQVFKTARVHSIDAFFLDVEGGEAKVLEGMDWDVPVGMWIIELNGSDPDKDEAVRRMMAEHGYASTIPEWDLLRYCPTGCTLNEVFVNRYYHDKMRKEIGRGYCKPL